MAAINAQVAVLSSVSTPSSASFQRQLAPARLSFRTFKLRSNVITTKSIRCNVHGGGAALGAQMNLFGRFARIFKSYANAFISIFEDPERMLEQTVLEMNQDLVKMREATAPVLASQKQLENKYKSALQASENWHKKAKVALSKGDEDLAREALKQRKYYDDSASAMKAHLDHQKAIIDNIAINTRHLESKILEAKSKSHTLKARAQSAKLSAKLSETLQNLNPGSALATFESMEHKVLSMEARAVALTQLASDDLQLQGKFASLESLSEDNDLASLKEEMRGSSTISELSQGRNLVIACSSSSPFLHVEIEIEKELIEQ